MTLGANCHDYFSGSPAIGSSAAFFTYFSGIFLFLRPSDCATSGPRSFFRFRIHVVSVSAVLEMGLLMDISELRGEEPFSRSDWGNNLRFCRAQRSEQKWRSFQRHGKQESLLSLKKKSSSKKFCHRALKKRGKRERGGFKQQNGVGKTFLSRPTYSRTHEFQQWNGKLRCKSQLTLNWEKRALSSHP